MERFLYSILSVCLSVVIVIQLNNFGFLSQTPTVLTVDVEKILRAHNSLIGKASKSDFDAALGLNNMSEKVSGAINAVSGGQLVLISPVVASTLENDITDEVIEYLGLPIPSDEGVSYIDEIDLPDTQDLENFDSEKMYEVIQGHLTEREKQRKKEEEEAEIRKKIP